MGSPTPPPPWIPQDDLLLMKAVEGGASLEALAKGAVRFSRRYTLQELQDRWRSLLYDPEISAEASKRIWEELEQSTTNSKTSKHAQKREAETDSIRRCYYAKRKRTCTGQLNQHDLTSMGTDFLLGETHLEDLSRLFFQDERNNMDGAGHEYDHGEQAQVENLCTEQGNGCKAAPHFLDHDMVLEDPFAPGDIDFDVFSEDFMNIVDGDGPEFDHVEQAQLEDLPFAPHILEDNTNTNPLGNGFEGNHVLNSPASGYESSSHHLQHSSTPAMPECRNRDEFSTYGAMKTSAARRQLDFFAAPLDYPSNFREDEKYGLSNLLFDYPADVNALPIPMVAAATDICGPSSSSAGELDAKDNDETSTYNEMKVSTDYAALADYLLNTSEIEKLSIDADVIDTDRYGLSKLLLDSPDDMNVDQIPDASEDVPFDVIEEQNIPISASVLSPQLPGIDRCGMSQLLLDSPADMNVDDQMLDSSEAIPLDVIEEQNIPTSASVLNPQFRELHNGVICCTLNTEDLDVPFNDDVVLPGPEPSSRRTRTVPAVTSSASDGLHCQLDTGVLVDIQGGPTVPAVTRLEVNNIQVESEDEMSPQPTGEPVLPDAEEQFSDNDAEIPYYSDVESLILDMDLIPEDQDMLASREAAKYQHEEEKREIIRLEQAAHSHMQRSLASHDAFAVLYGYRSKHYIKKLEVTLGRRAEGVVVDIDLSIEEPTDKISRRQAIIKLDEAGVYHMRNLGKCPISVDSKEAHRGQALTLHSNCLIEIRRIAFIFVVNQVRVNQYVDSISKKDATQL